MSTESGSRLNDQIILSSRTLDPYPPGLPEDPAKPGEPGNPPLPACPGEPGEPT
jgi:hypothetical protein